MCVVSMVMDHYYDKWKDYQYYPPEPPITVVDIQPTHPPKIKIREKFPTQEEINEFHELLRKAREYDKRHNQPDCELDEKKERLQRLADELGIKITFG